MTNCHNLVNNGFQLSNHFHFNSIKVSIHSKTLVLSYCVSFCPVFFLLEQIMFKYIVLLGLISLAVAAPSGRVVNGTNARIEDYPWMASLHIWAGHNCGGSILNERWILSAAHCDASTIEVGTDRWNYGQKVAVKRWIKHENYDDYTLEHDIAVVELAEPLVFGPNIQPVRLPEQGYEVPGSYEVKANLTGFGYEQVCNFLLCYISKSKKIIL